MLESSIPSKNQITTNSLNSVRMLGSSIPSKYQITANTPTSSEYSAVSFHQSFGSSLPLAISFRHVVNSPQVILFAGQRPITNTGTKADNNGPYFWTLC